MLLHNTLLALVVSASVTVQAVPMLRELTSLITPAKNYEDNDALDLARRDDVDPDNDNPDGSYPYPSPPANVGVISTDSAPTWDGSCAWTVPGVGKFTSRLHVANNSWSNSNFDSSNANGRYFVKVDRTYGYGYMKPSQVVVASGRVSLTADAVPATSTETMAVGGQMITAWNDIQSGSVRTLAKGDVNPGAVYGFFFFGTTNRAFESDIELRTTYASNISCTTQYDFLGDPTNHKEYSVKTGLPNKGVISQWHEYRMDWVAESYVKFYVDGILVDTKTGGLPRGPGNWIWNSWSNSTFAQGPSRQKNILTIGSIDLYVNRTGITCGIYSS